MSRQSNRIWLVLTTSGSLRINPGNAGACSAMSLDRIGIALVDYLTRRCRLLAVLLLLFSGAGAAADDSRPNQSKGVEFFESKIRPVLAQQCYKCHSAGAGHAEGALRLHDAE